MIARKHYYLYNTVLYRTLTHVCVDVIGDD